MALAVPPLGNALTSSAPAGFPFMQVPSWAQMPSPRRAPASLKEAPALRHLSHSPISPKHSALTCNMFTDDGFSLLFPTLSLPNPRVIGGTWIHILVRFPVHLPRQNGRAFVCFVHGV